LTRIKSHNIQLGECFVLPAEQNVKSAQIQKALEEEQNILLRGEQKAEEIIEAAKALAQEILEEAKTKAQEDMDSFIEMGCKEGFAKITEQMQDTVLVIDKFAQCQFEIKRNIIKSAHLDIVKLVVEIARKVCSKSLELDENVIKEITQNAIGALKDKENITIIVNPEMAETLYAISDELKEKIPQLDSIKIIEDRSVSPDGTIVESPLSRVDCRVSSQINEIAEKLMAKLDSTPKEEFSEDLDNLND